MKVKKLILVCVLTFLLTLTLCISVSAYEYRHKGLQSIPSDVYISTAFNANQRARIQDAMETWNTTCFAYDCLVFAGTTNESTYPSEDETNTVTFLSTSEDYLGQTYYTNKKYTFLWLNWYLEEFDMNINPSYTWYVGENEAGISMAEHDLETVALHEFGHVLGLAHVDYETYTKYDGTVQSVVMYPTLGRGETKRTLSEDERLGIVDLY